MGRRGGPGRGICVGVHGAELNAIARGGFSSHGTTVRHLPRGAGGADGDGGFATVIALVLRRRRAYHIIPVDDGRASEGGYGRRNGALSVGRRRGQIAWLFRLRCCHCCTRCGRRRSLRIVGWRIRGRSTHESRFEVEGDRIPFDIPPLFVGAGSCLITGGIKDVFRHAGKMACIRKMRRPQGQTTENQLPLAILRR
jgi:hypothetical protein